jgi:hypothetical protein
MNDKQTIATQKKIIDAQTNIISNLEEQIRLILDKHTSDLEYLRSTFD